MKPKWPDRAWDALYSGTDDTDWEKLPWDDLTKFLSPYINFSRLRNVLDIGCGRGYRLLTLLLTNSRALFPDLKVVGIDVSRQAIETARKNLADVRQQAGRIIEQFPDLAGAVLNADVVFEVADILTYPVPADTPRHDLVIDWMCFHEIDRAMWPNYVAKVAEICSGFYVLKVFSVEGSSVRSLRPVVPNVPKHQFSASDIEALFGGNFHMYASTKFDEKPTTIAQHTDGLIAAKRAYLMRRK